MSECMSGVGDAHAGASSGVAGTLRRRLAMLAHSHVKQRSLVATLTAQLAERQGLNSSIALGSDGNESVVSQLTQAQHRCDELNSVRPLAKARAVCWCMEQCDGSAMCGCLPPQTVSQQKRLIRRLQKKAQKTDIAKARLAAAAPPSNRLCSQGVRLCDAVRFLQSTVEIQEKIIKKLEQMQAAGTTFAGSGRTGEPAESIDAQVRSRDIRIAVSAPWEGSTPTVVSDCVVWRCRRWSASWKHVLRITHARYRR